MGFISKVKKVCYEINENACQISSRTGRKRFLLTMDMVGCLLKYSASPNNYSKFEFYNLDSVRRATYVTYGLSQKMIRTFNNPSDIDIFENKLRFAVEFSDMFKRGYLDVTEMDFREFERFCEGKDKFICKPVEGSQGADIKVHYVDDVEEMFSEIKKNYGTGYMLEEWIQQHPLLTQIYPDAVNCLRIITVYDGKDTHFLTGGVTFGIETEIANGAQPSIIAPVNLDNGVMEKPAATFGSELYVNHPRTGARIQGVQLPFWNEIKDMLRKACKRVPTVGYVGWDIAITPNGPLIIEGNTTPGYKYYQIPRHLEKGIGNREVYEKYIG